MNRPYQKLIAWKEAYGFALAVYRLTKTFPTEERFALQQQVRKAATSVPINIAEGNTKQSPKDRARFFEIALASLNEVHCELLFARDLAYITSMTFENLDDHLQRVSYLLVQLLRSQRTAPRSL
jgi:four helix bundle protein